MKPNMLCVIYYDVIPCGVAFVSPFKTFVFSERSTEIEKADHFVMVTELLRTINCEQLIDNYHEMMVNEKLITDVLKQNGFVPIRIEGLDKTKIAA